MHRDRRIYNAILNRSLFSFVQCGFWVTQGKLIRANWYLDAICHALEKVDRGETQRLLIMAPPRTFKSFIASMVFPVWVLGRDPTRRVVTTSYSLDLAEGFAFESRRLMLDPRFRQAFPACRLDPSRQMISDMRTLKGGYRMTTSVGGTLTGKGGSIIIVDDPLKAQDAPSEPARRAVIDWFRETLVSRLDNPKRDAIVVVAQRLHTEDLPGYLLEQGGWTVLTLPATATEDADIPVHDEFTWHRSAGSLLDPERLGEDELNRFRKEQGAAAFEAQYQQMPVMPEGNLFKMEWIDTFTRKPRRHQREAIIQSWDTAAVPGQGNDYSVCTTWTVVGSSLYLLDVYRAQLAFPELLQQVVHQKERHNAHLALVENRSSGIQVGQTLRAVGHSWVKPILVRGSKLERASQQTSKFEAGHVFVPVEAPWVDAFLHEVAAFPNGKHDDQVDSMVQFLCALDMKANALRHLSYYGKPIAAFGLGHTLHAGWKVIP